MEAFGRLITVMCGLAGLIFSIVFYETAAMGQQKSETVQSISNAFVQRMIRNQMISETEWEIFEKELGRFGTYRIELTVSERRNYKGEGGERYLFTELDEIRYGEPLAEGSYLRLVVTEEVKSVLGQFLYGDGLVFYAGGRIG